VHGPGGVWAASGERGEARPRPDDDDALPLHLDAEGTIGRDISDASHSVGTKHASRWPVGLRRSL
jgi:hypothetical protein